MDGPETDLSIVEDDVAYRGQLPNDKESIINRRRELLGELRKSPGADVDLIPGESDEKLSGQLADANIGAVAVELAHPDDVEH